MTDDFPKFSRSAKLGEKGVSIVSKVVNDDFGWIFRRNPQEHDFGIDGQIDIVTPDGSVTGQVLAVQIKCGKSFLDERNQWGYVYRGEQKHLNYLANYPLPVIVIICDPESGEAFWELFQATAAEPTGKAWKIMVPFSNKLGASKEALLNIVGPVRDAAKELADYWALNKMLKQSDIIFYALDAEDVRTLEVDAPRAFFDRLRSTREIAADSQSKVEIFFSGYDNDSRELFEIPEVRAYVAKLDHVLGDLFFFVRTAQPTHTLITFALCQTSATVIATNADRRSKKVSFEPRPFADFIHRHCGPLNELTEWINMPEEKEKELFFDVVDCLKVPEANAAAGRRQPKKRKRKS
ncbi:DUF4365 and DUF1817 domain-containing protein [Luteibacter sp. 9135]|uniref:DUF4365 and DUF1817 domain-containing protein n=1 Tax=Luteibacter sp. 9135 TaxID=1500893 RepID=UPI0009E079D2|nr:DUF4365 and DUF1817 domain-containing protein [Luteibacter sp. 9135]